MSAYKIQTPGNYPKENIQHLEHGESLKSRSHTFLSHGAASEQQVLFQTGEKQLKENAKFFRLFMEIKPYLKHMSSNGLKDSEWDMRTM
jgi:hypothetical protein